MEEKKNVKARARLVVSPDDYPVINRLAHVVAMEILPDMLRQLEAGTSAPEIYSNIAATMRGNVDAEGLKFGVLVAALAIAERLRVERHLGRLVV